MKYSIITPTYKRRGSLERAITSLLSQTHKDWEMIIINDSPFDESYRDFVVNDSRIRYYVNERNMGVNYSRNSALMKLASDSHYVIFLDDDDYFAPDTLKAFENLILLNSNKGWFMTNRALKDGTPLTKGAVDGRQYRYAWDYLIRKKIRGDATHCISTDLITEKKITFLQTVKQGEEWYFFYQVGQHENIHYFDHNSTISDGYNQSTGLNFRKRSKKERLETLFLISKEGVYNGCGRTFLFQVYIAIRIALVVLRLH